MAPILNTVDASKLLGTSRTYPLGATPAFSTHLALDKYQMQQLAKNQRKQAINFALKKAGNAYLGGVIGTASTMFGSSLGNKLFGNSKMGDFAGQALGAAASKILGNTLKAPSGGGLADIAISGVTSSVFNQNTAGGRAASSIVNGIGSQVAQNITKGAKIFSGFNIGNIAGIGLGAAQAAMKPKSEYSGEKGRITSTLDMIDSVGTAAVSAIPGVGQIFGLVKIGLDTGFKALNNAGYGTSGMTTTDALLGSNIVGEALLPLSMINGKFGKTTTTLNPRTFQENQDLAKVESSYSNTVKQGIDAWNKQGKNMVYCLTEHIGKQIDLLICMVQQTKPYLIWSMKIRLMKQGFRPMVQVIYNIIKTYKVDLILEHLLQKKEQNQNHKNQKQNQQFQKWKLNLLLQKQKQNLLFRNFKKEQNCSHKNLK